MATWTTPKTWTNAAVTAAEFNTHIRDNLTWLKGAFTQLNVTTDSAKAKITPALMGARAYKGSTTSVVTATQTTVALDNEAFDSDSFHDNATNNSRFTIPASAAGYYLCGANVFWASSATGRRVIWIYLNGGLTTYITATENDPNTTGGNYQSTDTLFQFAAADYIELVVFQSSGSNLTLDQATNAVPVMWIHRISST